jgi:LexA-binding, inner membrane-associated putative hydrolase
MAARASAPRASLGTYLVACQLPDLVWPVLLLLGVERVRIVPGITAASPMDFEWYPWTHSLLMSLVTSSLFALAYRAARKDGPAALWLGISVFSHWVLDWITHRPDLQLVPWSPARVGLGLWNHPLATMVTEGAMFAVGIWMYLGATRAKDKIGSIAFYSLCAALVILFAMSSTGPPPPNPKTLAIVALSVWLFVPWAYWIDRHREARPAQANG